MVWMLRFVLLVLLVFFFYHVTKFFLTSNRKLKSARKQQRFLFLDNEDVRINFLLTYKGVVFTGEKYLGSSDTSVSISIWPHHAPNLKQEWVKDDFYFIEKRIREKYPNAEIQWKIPFQEFLQDT